jgi:hypothetical protein
MDRAMSALIKDLKRRGLFDDTLVVWRDEFGQTPFRECRTAAFPHIGREHHPFSNIPSWPVAASGRGPRMGRPTSWGVPVFDGLVNVHDIEAPACTFSASTIPGPIASRAATSRLTEVEGRIIQEVLG